LQFDVLIGSVSSVSVTGKDTYLTVVDLKAMKQRAEKIVCLTAYDASYSALLDKQGVDVILVGDSLGMVVQGEDTTLPVTVEHMVYHARCVARGRLRAMIVVDLPFMSYSTPSVAAENAARLVREGSAQMVKLEGGMHRVEVVNHLVKQGIPVCAHLGLTPQSIHQLGGYRVQGKDDMAASRVVEDARLLQDVGASLLVLECVPSSLAAEITRALDIPTIGIGAGKECDGQVLVLYDMLGVVQGKQPKFSKNFLHEAGNIGAAVSAYVAAVRSGQFPGVEHSF